MRSYLLFGALLGGLTLAACGGSSSETPPPLQPDPAGFRYAPSAARQAEEPDSDDPSRANPDAALDPSANPRAPVPAPAGSGRPAR